MTKKRYIKLLMAHGYTRNEARDAARAVALINDAYSQLNKFQKISGDAIRFPLDSYSDDIKSRSEWWW